MQLVDLARVTTAQRRCIVFDLVIALASVDPVCINQRDIGERNHQVFMMNRVYSAAEQALVWLGEARDHSDIVIKRLKELAESQEMTVIEQITLRCLTYD